MVGILTRAPRVGHGKSRLAAGVGSHAAAVLSRAFLLDVARKLGHDDRWGCALFVEPAEACDEVAALTGIADARPQASGGLGGRLAAAAASLATDGARAVVLLGSDAPLVEDHDVVQAIEALERYDVVFGPATDGGYYAVGLGPAALDGGVGELFSDEIPWSTSRVLEESERVARGLGWSVAHIRPRSDIDTVRDLASLRRELAARPGGAANTRKALRTLDDQQTRTTRSPVIGAMAPRDGLRS